MKRKILVLGVALLMLLAAGARGEFVYTNTSVATCEQTHAMYSRFYQSGELSVNIPGLAEGLVPQGLDDLPAENWLLFAGYRSDKGNSALIAVDLATNEVVKEVILYNMDGSAYNGHAGGVCVTEKNIFLSNAHRLLRISLETFRALPASGGCRFEEEIPVPVNASYCCYDEGVLWVGEFQYGAEYKTDASHRIRTADGAYRAWACGYVLDKDSENELKPSALTEGGDARPDYILSTTERIQGITVKEGKIYLSQSYGRRASSSIYRYQNVLARAADAEVALDGVSVPVWFLDKNALEDTLIAPPMTECLCTIGGCVYVLFESGAETYRAGKNPSENPMDRVFRLVEY